MLTHLELLRPDGTPVGDDEIPATGTLLVLQLEDVTTALAHLPYTAAITATVIGWVPKGDRSARALLAASCRVLNKRDDPVPPDNPS